MNAAAERTSASAMLTASTSQAATGANARLDTSCRLAEPAWVRRELLAACFRDECGSAGTAGPLVGSAEHWGGLREGWDEGCSIPLHSFLVFCQIWELQPDHTVTVRYLHLQIALRDCRPLRDEERSLVMQVSITQQKTRSFCLLSALLFSPNVAQRMQK